MTRFISFFALVAAWFAIAAMVVVPTVLAHTPVALSAQLAPLGPKEAADILVPSLAHLVRNGSDRCTAFKVAPATYLTAKHCTRKDVSRDFLRVDSRYRFVEQYITPDEPKDDWAIIKTGYNDPRVRSLRVGCDEKIYLGMPVAYAGYPSPLDLTMVMGRVISTLPIKSPFSKSEFATNVTGGAGASGSPVISLDTGDVIGILTEGIINGSFRRQHEFAAGVENIKNTSLCREVVTTASNYQ
jgi:V8-like Glu-specific endopeptidase